MPDVSDNGNSNENVVGIRFQKVGKVYHFSADGIEGLKEGDFVVVETVRGREVGQVVQTNVQPHQDRSPLKPVKRRATAQDMVLQQRFKLQEKEALTICRQKAKDLNLPIRIARVEYNYKGNRLTVFFMADDKLDRRAFRRALARHFRVKIEMHPMSARDFAKAMGGCGACSGPLCCSTFLSEFAPVSIKAAKVQDVTLIPSEITGMCGRLRCCLRYECQTYEEAKQAMPQKGREVVTELGRGTIVDTNVLRETVVVDFGTYQAEVPLAGLKVEPRESEKKRPSTKRRR
jgi:cell fate regulator YaaT (PSP1 superfamily)